MYIRGTKLIMCGSNLAHRHILFGHYNFTKYLHFLTMYINVRRFHITQLSSFVQMTYLATFNMCFESSEMALPKPILAIHLHIVTIFRLFLMFLMERMNNVSNTLYFLYFLLTFYLRKTSRSRFVSLRFQSFSYHTFLSNKPQNLLSIWPICS